MNYKLKTRLADRNKVVQTLTIKSLRNETEEVEQSPTGKYRICTRSLHYQVKYKSTIYKLLVFS